jgi:hypothetical protein
METTMKKPQADKANRAQVDLHIERQRRLGDRMIDDDDMPTAIDVIVTVLLVLTVFAAYAMGYL